MAGRFWDSWNPLKFYRSEMGGWYVRLFWRGFHIQRTEP
jgi:hypothetical protein